MRVLFVNRMASMARGGGETFDLEMARELVRRGMDVSILSGKPILRRRRLTPKDWWYSESDGGLPPIADHALRTPYFGWFPWDKFPGGWRLRVADFKLFERAAARWAFDRRHLYDAIHVCELLFFVREFRRLESRYGPNPNRPKLILRITAPDFYDPEGAIALADAVIASGATMERLHARGFPVAWNIPNAVDTRLFKPRCTTERARFSWPESNFLVLYVARFQAVKNHEMLLDAFRLLLETQPGARLVLAGSGPLEPRIRKKASILGISNRVSFLGEVAYHQLASLYSIADVAVISSDYESFSFTALEAMASGLPLVTTATDWVPRLLGVSPADMEGLKSERRVIETCGGAVTPVGDARMFAEGLARLAKNAALRKQMGAWNRARVEREFSWPSSGDAMLALYRALNILKSSPPDT